MTLDIHEASLNDLLTDCRDEWRQLAATRFNHAPFMSDIWVESYCEGFPRPEAYFLGAWDAQRLTGLAPLMQSEERILGQRLRVLQSLCNDWKFRYSFLAPSNGDDVLRGLWQWLLTAGRWDVVSLDRMPEGSRTLIIGAASAANLGWRCVTIPLFQSPWKCIPVTADSWDHGLKNKFKSNLRNREKRLARLGPIEFQVVREPHALPEALETFYELEASGWKGDAQTAIKEYPPARTLFDGIVNRAPGVFWVPILSVGGTAIAAQLIQVQHETMYLLKVGYHPEYRAYSPGQLITARSVAYGMRHGMRTLDFLGAEMAWKRDWCSDAQPNFRLSLYAPTMAGQMAYWSTFGLKEFARKIPGAQSLVGKLRELRTKS